MRFRFRYVVVVLLVALVAAAAPLISKAIRFKMEIDKVVVGEVDVASVPNGSYRGTCDVGAVVATVEVEVASGRITTITLLRHDNGQGKAAESITGKVIEAQSLKVDAISGATYSSRVILKAIENALRSG
jgi:uncharacterized protein with FMN-binding domain